MNAIQTLRTMGSIRAVVLGVVGVILLIAFAVLSMKLTSPVMSPLYNNLSAEDSAVIATELGGMGVNFRVVGGGSEIQVESSEVLKVRMALAQKGLPSKGSIVGYEVFDRDSPMGTSSFINDINLIRALEGELSRTISSLSAIKSARVHLVVPKRELFQKGKIEPTAAVVLTLRDRTKMPKNEILAVRHLVASAVPGLKASNVTVADSSGEFLVKASSDDGDIAGSGGAFDSEEYKVNYENRTKKMIEDLLEEAVGVGKVRVQVSAEMGFDRVTTSSETYDPNGQVARSVQTSESTEKDGGSEGGAVSAANNLPGNAAPVSTGGEGASATKTEETTNFEISKTVTNKVSEIGVVKKISVAVLVDGSYDTDAEGNKIYKPRADEELERFRALVRTAIGYDEKRGDKLEVVNMQFSRDGDQFIQEEGAFDWLKRDLEGIIKILMIGIVFILAILMVARPLVNNAFKINPADLEAEEAAAKAAAAASDQLMGMGGAIPPAAGGVMPSYAIAGGVGGEEIDLDMIQGKMDVTPSRKINDLINNNPEETLSVIRTWLAQKA